MYVFAAALALAPWVALGILWSRTNNAVKVAEAAQATAEQYDARLLGILERLDAIVKRGVK